MNENTCFKQQDCEAMVINCMKSDPWDRRYALETLEPRDFTNARLRFEFENIDFGQPYHLNGGKFYTQDYIKYLCEVLRLMTRRREVYLRLYNGMRELKSGHDPDEISREVKVML